jgi:hypothetical protein
VLSCEYRIAQSAIPEACPQRYSGVFAGLREYSLERDLESLATGWRRSEQSVELRKEAIGHPAKGKDQKVVFAVEVVGEDTHAQAASVPYLADCSAFDSHGPNDVHGQ